MKEASMPIQSLIARYGAPVSANPTNSDVDASSSGAKGQGVRVWGGGGGGDPARPVA